MRGRSDTGERRSPDLLAGGRRLPFRSSRTASPPLAFCTSVRGILVRGSMPPCRLRQRKVYHPHPIRIQKTALFCVFSLFNFSSIFPGSQLTPFAPMCGRPWPFGSLISALRSLFLAPPQHDGLDTPMSVRLSVPGRRDARTSRRGKSETRGQRTFRFCRCISCYHQHGYFNVGLITS